jgi:tRNA-2-methylthio-N6-dimethylallyladenosine synthase
MPNDVPEEEKKRRLGMVLKKQSAISLKKYQKKIGTVQEILVEGFAKTQHLRKEQPGHVWTGRTSCNKIVNFFSPSPRSFLHQFVFVKILAASHTALQAEIL